VLKKAASQVQQGITETEQTGGACSSAGAKTDETATAGSTDDIKLLIIKEVEGHERTLNNPSASQAAMEDKVMAQKQLDELIPLLKTLEGQEESTCIATGVIAEETETKGAFTAHGINVDADVIKEEIAEEKVVVATEEKVAIVTEEVEAMSTSVI
jgi:hypothetical protein